MDISNLSSESTISGLGARSLALLQDSSSSSESSIFTFSTTSGYDSNGENMSSSSLDSENHEIVLESSKYDMKPWNQLQRLLKMHEKNLE